MQSTLTVQNLVKRVADLRVEATFSVGAAERIALLGPSGCGKTTLLRTVAGLEPLDSGTIHLQGEDLSDRPPESRALGVVFQDQALFPMLTVLENAAFGLEMRGVSRTAREPEARTWLERVGLASRERTPIAQLSGGERQRLALVRAWIWRPKALLLDEPFSALDSEMRQSLRALVKELHTAFPVPLLFVTHDEEEAQDLGTDRIRAEVLPGVDGAPGVRRFLRGIP